MTLWHITFTAYGARIHGDERPTVDRKHNTPGDPFVQADPYRHAENRARMSAHPVRFSSEQRRFIESTTRELAHESGWTILACAAAADHVHMLAQIPERFHGKQARALLKRKLTQALDEHWECPERPDGSSWWGEGGSARAVRDDEYRTNAIRYIEEQAAIRER